MQQREFLAVRRTLARRLCSAAISVSITLATVSGVAVVLPGPMAGAARASDVTASRDNLRTGWDRGDPGLTPPALRSGSFGRLFSRQVKGQVYAQPLIVGRTLIVATEQDWVYGLNAVTGRVKWADRLGTPWSASSTACTDLPPTVGVTSTPVYDPGTKAVYLVAEVLSSSTEQAGFLLFGIKARTGRISERVPIGGHPFNDRGATFDAFDQWQRTGLLLLGGRVYAGFGSHCDDKPFAGFVAGVNVSTRAVRLWTDEAGLADEEGGIWQSGGGLMSDGPGRIFFASGNGVSPAPRKGSSPPSQLAESVVRLAVQSNGSLAAQDFFSPGNAPFLDSVDGDLGSGGPVGLPFGTAALPDLLVQIGKDGRVFVLNANNLGGREQGPGNSDAAVSISGPYAGQWGHPAAFADTPALTAGNVAGSNDYVYYVGKNSTMRYLRGFLGGAGGVTPVLSSVAQSDQPFGYTAGSPVVTSNGTDPTSAVVWVVNTSDDTGATGALEAYPAVPPAPAVGSCSGATPCSVAPLWTFPITGVGKFTTPATDSGRVYIATRGVVSNGTTNCALPKGTSCGELLGFGSPASAPLGGASPVAFGQVPVGAASTSTSVTVSRPNTASGAVSVTGPPTTSGTGFAVAGPFEYTPSGSSTATPVTSWPQLMNPGDSLTAEGVTLTPAVPGGATGSLQFPTDSSNFPVVSVSLSGTGTQPGFYTPTTSETSTAVPVKTNSPVQLSVTNDSAVSQTLTAGTSNPLFTVSPSSTGEILPGTSVPLTITYKPTVVTVVGTPDTGTLTVTGTDGANTQTQTTLSLSGTSAADVVPTMTPTPNAV